MSKHTPTPWEVNPFEISGGHLIQTVNKIIDGDYNEVAALAVVRSFDSIPNVDATKENAEFIVRACNVHDDLVAVLKMHHEHCIKTQPEYRERGTDGVAFRATVQALAKAGQS